MIKSLYILLAVMYCTISDAQGVYQNSKLEFKFSFDDSWKIIEKQDSILLYNNRNQIELSVNWLTIQETRNTDNLRIGSKDVMNNNCLRIYNSFSYHILENLEGEKFISAVSKHNLKIKGMEVIFTAKIPESYIDYEMISVLNKITKSFEVL